MGFQDLYAHKRPCNMLARKHIMVVNLSDSVTCLLEELNQPYLYRGATGQIP